MEIIQENSFYDSVFVEGADKRVANLFLMSDPLPLTTIVITYLYFVTKCGPEFMKNRKPFELKGALMLYNFVQVLASVWMTIELSKIFLTYNWTCQRIDYSDKPEAVWTTRVLYVYFLAKISELLDTVFFVLRKKDNQISFLHLYHHASMPILTWIGMKWFAGGHTIFIPMINSFVHIVMYLYYFLTALGPNLQKYLWWKKYITTIQLIQFTLTLLHNSFLFFIDCGYPRQIAFITVPNSIFFYVLFTNFYKKSYKGKSKESKIETKVEEKTK